jgi:hypothetical protein
VLLSSGPYSFQNADIGGGGFVDGVFFSPTQKNVMYARTDIGGLYKTVNGGTSWNQLLDFVGPAASPFGFSDNNQYIGVLSFAIDPENANHLYADVGEYSGTNGAVFYSTDGGVTWGKTSLSFYVGGNSNGRGEGERIAVDPYDSNILFLGSNNSGLWKSTDAGHSFSQVSSFSTSSSINFVYFNPYGGSAGTATQNLFVGVNSTQGVSPQTTGALEPTNLYQTTNGGGSWSEIASTSSSPAGKNVAAAAVSSLTRSGTTATVTTSAANSVLYGDIVTIAGATPAAYDGTFTVTGVTNSTTFTYSVASGNDTATGTITAADNYSLMPNHAALASDGNMYLTYSNAQAPNGVQTTGGVYRYNTNSGVWTVISPQIPNVSGSTQFGYMGLALDPESSTTVVVTSINRYAGIDALWRTTNSTAAAPTWVALFDTSSSQNYGYGGYNTTRNTSTAPWVASFGDGVGNWPCSVAIDPYNSAHIIYGNGQGLWATNLGTSTTKLSGANSWYFPDTGIEFTAVNDLATASSGTPLYSAIGDIVGFAHTTLTSSPAQGQIAGGGGSSVDVAAANPNYSVLVGGVTNGGSYSSNGGYSYTSFASSPSGASDGTVAMTWNGSTATIAWAPSGSGVYYSNNLGSTWTAATGGLPAGGKIVADRINPQDYYYFVANSGNNQLLVYASTNGAVSFTLASTVTISSASDATLTANPYTAGDLWLTTSSNGLWHSTNFGSTFSSGAGVGVTAAAELALGKNAPGQSYPAIYIWGSIGGVYAAYRSDDKGATWLRINDAADQWGGLVATVAADPNVFGRVYLGVNGRGIIIGNPVTSLPAGWSDADVNTPGDPGFATNSTNVSTGAVVNQWIVNGGGAGIANASDQFNFAAQSLSGDGSVVAELTALNNAGTGTAEAGVMFRGGPSTATDPFVGLLQTTAGQLVFEYRASSGGAVTSTTLSSINIGSEYVNLIRKGSAFGGYYSTDGVHWTQLGSTISVPLLPTTASIGLAVTAGYNPQLSSAYFSNVEIVPAVFTDITGNHSYAVNLNPAVAGQLQIFVDIPESSTPTYRIALSQIPSLTFNMGSGTDTLTVDEANGSPVPTGGIVFNSGSGGDSLAVLGAKATTTANLVVNDNSLVNFSAGKTGSINYIPISALNLAANAKAVVNASTTQAGRSVLMTAGLSFTGSSGAWQGQLNLNNNDMIVHGGSIGTLTSEAAEGYASSTEGIISTTALNDPTHLTAVGVIQNSVDGTASGTALYSSASGSLGLFDGVATVNSDVLLKYTYFGDANLGGQVDGSDYSRIDSAWLSGKTGWFNGDFNFDGVVDGSDYTLIDNAFNAQGASFVSQVAAAAPAVARAIPVSYAVPAEAAEPDQKKSKRASLFALLGLAGRE